MPIILDRTVPPPIRKIHPPHFPWPQALQLKEGLPLFVLNAGNQPIIKLELICDAGSWYEPQNGIAYFTAKMLQEGTQNKSAQDIAHYIDRYGASFHAQIQPDTCTFTLITLSKHLAPMLALLVEIVLTPTFDEKRLVHLQHLTTQALKVEAQKNSQVARKKLKNLLFGTTHPYGRSLTEEAIADVTVAHLKPYYQNKLLARCRLLVSGQVREEELQTIQYYLQSLPIQTSDPGLPPQFKQDPTKVYVEKKGSLQAAISTGKVLLSKAHPDYLPLLVANELLGGYFGSRLMRNIREQKGYTYGIFSQIVPLKQVSYLLINTEVIQKFAQATCQEIEREIEHLQNVPVPVEELAILQNYMLGTFLTTVSDPFSIMEKFKAAYLHGLDQTYYKRLYDTIVHTSAPQLMTLFQQYLSIDSLSQVVVG